MTEFQTPLAQPQERSHIRPYIPQTILISRDSQKAFRQKYHKYTHRLDSTYDKPFLRSISRLKYLQSFHLYILFLDRNPHIMQKLVKPFRKYLTDISKGLKDTKTEKLLPKLAQLSVLPDSSNTWKLLLSRVAFKKLSFQLSLPEKNPFLYNSWKPSKPSLLMRYKAALSRNFPRMNQLEGLKIIVSNKDVSVALLLMLQVVSSKAPLYSLKSFHLIISLDNSPTISITSPLKINKAIEHLTSLTAHDPECYSLFISRGEFKNLATLDLAISPNVSTWDFRHLSHFKGFLKLKKLTFAFTATSIDREKEFFENFTAAPSLEYFDFTMIGFSWNNQPLTKNNRKAIQDSFVAEAPYIHFFDCLREFKNLKILALTIKKGNGTRSCPNLAGRFASLFIRRLTTLERVNYSNPPQGEPENNKPLKLEDFWKGLEQSKETLHTVSIISPEIVFPVSIEAIETRFPKLKNLVLEGNVLYATKIGTLWRRIPSLKHVCVQNLALNDEKRLKEFLDNVQKIPEEMDVTLFLDVDKIRQEFLMNCLRNFIEEVKVKGKFGIYFKNVEVENIKSYLDILLLVVNKGSFHTFKMDMKNTWPLFYVMKQEVFMMAEDLADEYGKLNL